jgi:hypothetical protein
MYQQIQVGGIEMKRVMVLTADKKNITQEKRNKIMDIALQEQATMVGVLEYPILLLTKEANILADKMKKLDIDMVVMESEEFLLVEIVTSGVISKTFDNNNIKIVDIETKLEWSEIRYKMPLDLVKTIFNLSYNQSLEGMNNIMIITQREDDKQCAKFIKENTNKKIATVFMNQFTSVLEEGMRKVIDIEKINEVIIYGDNYPMDFKYFIESLKEEGMKISYGGMQEKDIIQEETIDIKLH